MNVVYETKYLLLIIPAVAVNSPIFSTYSYGAAGFRTLPAFYTNILMMM
jgi:hypothetical protein